MLAFVLCAVALGPATASSSSSLGANSPQTVPLVSGEVEVRQHPVTGVAASVRRVDGARHLPEHRPTRADPLAQAGTFLREVGDLFGLSDPDAQLRPVGLRHDPYGGSHLTYQQVHHGVPVFAGVLRVHFNASGEVTGANGVVLPDLEISAVPAVGAAAARERALDAARKRSNKTSHSRVPPFVDRDPQLAIYRQGLLQGIAGADHLAWEIEVRGAPEKIFIDAHSGEVLARLPVLKHALKREVYDGGAAPADLVWQEGDTLPFTGTHQDDVNRLIEFSEDTYNLFAGMSNGTHLSWDGADGAMKSTLENPAISCPNSPRWDGEFIDFCVGNVTDDLVGHEWGHAYTDSTHDLATLWQPSFLAQAYSDIWGELIDQLNGVDLNTPDTARTDSVCTEFLPGPAGETSYRWLLGEDLASTPGPGPIRDLWHPECGGDPGRVADTVNTYHCLSTDALGGRANSAIASHVFALLVDGGTYNGVAVPAIGATKAAHIYWRAQTVYQTPASDYLDHSYALENSCADLLGTNLWTVGPASPTPALSGQIVTVADCTAVASAIQAVELRQEPTHCGFGRILESSPPPLCDGLGSAVTIDATDWEAGLAGWTVSSRDKHPTSTTPDWAIVSYLPDGRIGSAVFGDNDPDRGDCVSGFESGAYYLQSPAIALPPAQPPRLAFDHWLATEFQQDGGNLKIQVNGGSWTTVPLSAFEFNGYNTSLDSAANTENNPLALEPAFSGADEGSWGGSWGRSLVDLAGVANPGDTIALRFELGLSGCGGRVGWYVDDVLLHSCSAELTCGNGFLDVSEQCDDGNSDTGDGCDAGCQLESGFLCSASQPPTGNLLTDGGFEAGSPNPSWTESSTNFGSPLCSDTTCPLGAVVPSAGDWLAWFGGADKDEPGIVLPETGTLGQQVTIPERAGATVEFDLWVGDCDPGSPSDHLRVLVDGQEIYHSGTCSETAGYTATTATADDFADGGTHTLTLEGTTSSPAGDVTNFFVDQVSLVGGPKPSICCRPTVTLTHPHTVASSEEEQACVTVFAGGDYGVGTTGDLKLTAGVQIVLDNGFEVQTGGRLTLGLNAELPSP